MFDILERKQDIDIIGGMIRNVKGKKFQYMVTDYFGVLEIKDKTLYHYKRHKKQCGSIRWYDIVLNFFLAKTQLIQKIRWIITVCVILPHPNYVSICCYQKISSIITIFNIDHIVYY